MKSAMIVCLMMSAAGSAMAALPTPVLSYEFNEAGGPALATGNAASGLGAPALQFFNNSGAQVNSLRGGAGSGPSGLAGDRAFDNSGASGIFASRASHSADFNDIDGLRALTLSGWFFIPAGRESLGRQAALFENSSISVNDPLAGFRLRGGARAGSSTLELRINRDSSVESSAAYTEVGQWINFAVTFDAGRVSFFKGTTTSPVSLVSSHTIGQSTIANDNTPLTIGSSVVSGLSVNPFAGLLDNMRIYDRAIPLAELEAVRSADVFVPEPGSLSMLGLAGLATLRRRRA